SYKKPPLKLLGKRKAQAKLLDKLKTSLRCLVNLRQRLHLRQKSGHLSPMRGPRQGMMPCPNNYSNQEKNQVSDISNLLIFCCSSS
ncbi:hypothetical protein DVH24_039346, partial [Malus domestica]